MLQLAEAETIAVRHIKRPIDMLRFTEFAMKQLRMSKPDELEFYARLFQASHTCTIQLVGSNWLAATETELRLIGLAYERLDRERNQRGDSNGTGKTG